MKRHTYRSFLTYLYIFLPLAYFSGSALAAGCNSGMFCPMVYDPVCGTDGKTYFNSCMAENACVEVAYPGICSEPPPACPDQDKDGFSPAGGDCGPRDCNDQDPNINPDMNCLDVYDPVCGVDGVTYNNSCEALRACVEIEHPGECANVPACSDKDRDGYSPDGGSCGPVDCNDNHPGINPGVMCSTVYDPVCGRDGITYSNVCEARRHACAKVAYRGVCQ